MSGLSELPHQKRHREVLRTTLGRLVGATVLVATAETNEADGNPMPVFVFKRKDNIPVLVQVWQDAEGNGAGHVDMGGLPLNVNEEHRIVSFTQYQLEWLRDAVNDTGNPIECLSGDVGFCPCSRCGVQKALFGAA